MNLFLTEEVVSGENSLTEGLGIIPSIEMFLTNNVVDIDIILQKRLEKVNNNESRIRLIDDIQDALRYMNNAAGNDGVTMQVLQHAVALLLITLLPIGTTIKAVTTALIMYTRSHNFNSGNAQKTVKILEKYLKKTQALKFDN